MCVNLHICWNLAKSSLKWIDQAVAGCTNGWGHGGHSGTLMSALTWHFSAVLLWWSFGNHFDWLKKKKKKENRELSETMVKVLSKDGSSCRQARQRNQLSKICVAWGRQVWASRRWAWRSFCLSFKEIPGEHRRCIGGVPSSSDACKRLNYLERATFSCEGLGFIVWVWPACDVMYWNAAARRRPSPGDFEKLICFLCQRKGYCRCWPSPEEKAKAKASSLERISRLESQ